MKRIFLIAFGLMLAAPSYAADNSVILTPGSGVTMRSVDVGSGVESMQHILGNTSGTSLAAPTAGADGVSNTALGLQTYNYPLVFNGTTWDRLRGDLTNGAFVNVKTSVLPTGGATSANQSTEIGSLATIATNSGSPIPAGTNAIGYLSGFSYAHISTATTTTVKSGAGVVHTICVNTLGTVASTITVDDALTATTPTIGVINSLTLLGCQTFDVAFATGLTLVTTGTAAPDVTVSYR